MNRTQIRIPRTQLSVEISERAINGPGDRRTVYIVRCDVDGCNRRLFDTYPGIFKRSALKTVDERSKHTVETICPACKTLRQREVTARPGVAVGSDGRWTCGDSNSGEACERFLMEVDATRGRVELPCTRCGTMHQVRIADIVQAAAEAVPA